MHMTFEKITPPAEPAPEHPAARAARMIRDLHLETIALIDAGTKFTRDGEDVSAKIRAACIEQVQACDEVMRRAENMDPKLFTAAQMILADLQETMGEKDGPDDGLKVNGLHDDGRAPSDG